MIDAHAYVPRYHRLVQVEARRITGLFDVLLSVHPDRDNTAWVKPHEVTVWADDRRTSGRVLYPDALAARVTDGIATLTIIRGGVFADVMDVEDDMLAVVALAAHTAIASGAEGER